VLEQCSALLGAGTDADRHTMIAGAVLTNLESLALIVPRASSALASYCITTLSNNTHKIMLGLDSENPVMSSSQLALAENSQAMVLSIRSVLVKVLDAHSQRPDDVLRSACIACESLFECREFFMQEDEDDYDRQREKMMAALLDLLSNHRGNPIVARAATDAMLEFVSVRPWKANYVAECCYRNEFMLTQPDMYGANTYDGAAPRLPPTHQPKKPHARDQGR
jgi:hypothetical protein